jgi:hypothetical protein
MEENCFTHQVSYRCSNSNTRTEVLPEACEGETKWGRRRHRNGRTRGNSCRAVSNSFGGPVKQTTKADIRDKEESYPVRCRLGPTAREEACHSTCFFRSSESHWSTPCCCSSSIALRFAFTATSSPRCRKHATLCPLHYYRPRDDFRSCSRRFTVRVCVFFFHFAF